MKITETELKQIIKEELEKALDESQWQDNIDADAKCAEKYKRNSPEYEKCLDEQGIAEDLDEDKGLEEIYVGPSAWPDRLFMPGMPGSEFTEKIANELMIDEESDFEAIQRALMDGLRRWKEYR